MEGAKSNDFDSESTKVRDTVKFNSETLNGEIDKMIERD